MHGVPRRTGVIAYPRANRLYILWQGFAVHGRGRAGARTSTHKLAGRGLKIKIDQSFVRGATAKGSRNAAIVALAEALAMETAAEGIESLDQLDLIRNPSPPRLYDDDRLAGRLTGTVPPIARSDLRTSPQKQPNQHPET